MRNSQKKSTNAPKTSSRKPQSIASQGIAATRNFVADIIVGTADGASFDLRLAFPLDAAGADRGFKAGKDL